MFLTFFPPIVAAEALSMRPYCLYISFLFTEKLSACRELRLRRVCRSLRRSGGRSGARRVTGARPDLLPPPAPSAMSWVSRSGSPRSAALSRTKSLSWAGEGACWAGKEGFLNVGTGMKTE